MPASEASSSPTVVWLKRDLRLQDHAPLLAAASAPSSIVLFIYEPELLHSAEFHAGHLRFTNECLQDLDEALQAIGSHIVYRVGEAVEVLESLWQETRFQTLRSHQESGNDITFARDKRVQAWVDNRQVHWVESIQTGVVRRLKSRDGWSRQWLQRMRRPILATPDILHPYPVEAQGRRDAASLGLTGSGFVENVQNGGMHAAQRTLDSFLTERGVDYRKAMSSPLTGWDSCSRLSPYLAFGALSIKQAHHATALQQRKVKAARRRKGDIDPRWTASLSSFQGRLRWHCHFMQKLETQPSLEFENLNRGFDGMRENEFDPVYFHAWKHGMTGYPMVDACMRSLRATGWLNFRMRAMLVSFASYHLWLHWRPVAQWLGGQFLDFEAGIHYSQVQMQAGTTGINTARIYSPIKQAKEHDPEGVFIRRWIPELAAIPTAYIHQPETMPSLEAAALDFQLGKTYPRPIVTHAKAYREAKRRVFAWRRKPEVRERAEKVYEKHGSRRRPPNRSRRSR